MLSRLIFISGNPVSRLVGEKLDPYWYEGNGIVVEYWDLTRLYHSEEALGRYFGGHEDFRFRFPRERRFLRRQEVGRAIGSVPQSTTFCHIDFGASNDFWLRRLFKRYNICYYVGPRRTSVPYHLAHGNETLGGRVRRFVTTTAERRLRVSYLIRKALGVLYRYTDYYQKPAFVVGSGRRGRRQWVAQTRSPRFVSAPSTDVVWETLPALVHGGYCVFVDDAVAYSPDQVMTKGVRSMSLSLDRYAANIQGAFDLIEGALGASVVIAAGGKYRYDDNSIFGGRDIVYGRTSQLIQHAMLVIGHSSSGVWQSIVNMKPIILLWDDSFTLAKNEAVTRSGAFLGVSPVMPSDLTDEHVRNAWRIDGAHYEALIEEYFRESNVEEDSRSLIVKELGLMHARLERPTPA